MPADGTQGEHAIAEVALAMHFIEFGRTASEPLHTQGGALDPAGMTYKLAVVAVETLQREGWHL